MHHINEMERARSALTYIDPGDHDAWLKVAMGLKIEFGEDGWTIFDEWSRQADNYNDRENRARWRSFKPGGGITIATVFGLARDAGWRDDGPHRVPSPEEVARRRAERSKAGAEAKAKADAAAADAARKASEIFAMSGPATGHNSYCWRKGIKPTETLREIEAESASAVLNYPPSAKGELLEGALLVVPIKVGGKLSSLQLVDGTGRKHFLAGSAIGGGYWASQSLPDGNGSGFMVLIGEGVATALSVLRAVPTEVGIAAMSNSNISAVARHMRERLPRADIVVLADLDKKTGEPDKHAVLAAQSVTGRLAVPRFAEGPSQDRKDFNDMMRLHGADAVRSVIEAGLVPRGSVSSAPRIDEKPKPKVRLIRASTITPEPVSWVWDGHLARGKVHILGGKPAAGKTTLAIAMAATASTGGSWPDGTFCKPGHVVIWSGEDDPADTLVPRLIAAGADLTRVHFVSEAFDDKETVPFDPATHLPGLAERLSVLQGVALLIVDPVVSAIAGDSYKNAEVRRALQPLADLAASSDCAVLGITHFTKGTGGRDPVERLTGSLAFGAVARIVLVAAKTEDDAEASDGSNKPSRIMMRAKSNIGPDGGGFGYDLEQRELTDHAGIITSVAKWGEAVHGSARELLAEAEATDNSNGVSVTEAMDWLRDLLANGPLEVTQIRAKATVSGHSWATVRRAQKKLAIDPQKQGMRGGWAWGLPRRCSQKPEDAPSKMGSTFGNFEHLRSGDDADDHVEGTL